MQIENESVSIKAAQPGQTWWSRFLPILILTSVCWLLFLADQLLFRGSLTNHGIVPRRLDGLAGILWAPFLHTSIKHLLANTLPLLILGGIICLRSKAEFRFVTGAGMVLGGVLTWLFGRTAIHVGASGLVFCFFGYLAALAVFERKAVSFFAAAFCLFAYGGVLKGVLPTAGPVSWEGHLAGLMTGITLGWLIMKVRKTA
jgi:membrane associated rhomboid family serine protease